MIDSLFSKGAVPEVKHWYSLFFIYGSGHNFRKIKALIGQSPSDFIRSYRLYEAKSLLETTDLHLSEVAWKVGFKDPAHFSKSFQETFGVLPSATNK